MEQVQRHYIKFNKSTLDISSLGIHAVEEEGYAILPVAWKLIEPFFTDYKSLTDYYPLFENGIVIGFRKKKLAQSRVVKNTDAEILKAIRHYENFIADCEIMVRVTENSLRLIYDQHYFDSITNQENIDRLTLVKETLYNISVTKKGNPYQLYETYTTKLDSLIDGIPIELPYKGPTDVSVYVIAKN